MRLASLSKDPTDITYLRLGPEMSKIFQTEDFEKTIQINEIFFFGKSKLKSNQIQNNFLKIALKFSSFISIKLPKECIPIVIVYY